MDRRSWPWKKKSSDKTSAEKTLAALESGAASLPSTASLGDQDNYKKPSYVQISVESYSHLTGLEDQLKTCKDQVKDLEDDVKALNEKLSTAHSEIITKENLVKQHAKVAEDAVSGWEKADAEALSLKSQLESVTLLKLTAEDRASHLDGALKECMRQIRNLKEEHEQKLHEVVLTKTKQWDKIKLMLEAKMADMDQELVRCAAENAALSRSLHERSNMLIQLSEEKSQAEAEIELLKCNIDSCEREINSHKYELHIAMKELEIRNEEKNMSVKSAEVANKQHLEGVKKIAKLEAECQRLRGLVRKKLPGPAALAQMKLEVESLGRDHSETWVKRSPGRPPSPHSSPLPEFSLDSVQNFHKETEFLTERLLAMEEETKMLKEALAKRNSELQAARSINAQTVSKLHSLEAELLVHNQLKSAPKSDVQITIAGSLCQNASNPPSLTMSEDGNDDERSCAGSWAATPKSELTNYKKEKNVEKSTKAENALHLELMDDFLEMEKLAHLSNNSNGDIASSVSNNSIIDIMNHDSLTEVANDSNFQSEKQSEVDPSLEQACVNSGSLSVDTQCDIDRQPLMKLQSRISNMLDSISTGTDVEKVLECIRNVVQETHDNLHRHPEGSAIDKNHHAEAACDLEASPEESEMPIKKEILLPLDSCIPDAEKENTLGQEFAGAIFKIHDFVLNLGKEAMAIQGTSPEMNGLSQKLQQFSAAFHEVTNRKISVVDFVLNLSHVLSEVSTLHFSVLGYKSNESETNGSDCIDKVALPENKAVHNSSEERGINGSVHFSDSTSDPDIPHDGGFVPSFHSNATSCKFSIEEFAQLKLERDNVVVDLASCTENLKSTKSQLQETEQLLAEVKSQLVSAQKLNGLAETQLKCMAESYNSLETRAEELQTEVNLLRARTEGLDNELHEERRNYQDALARCKDLQEQLQRIESSQSADMDTGTNQEEINAATEKLAECQETIYLLGKQLNALRPQAEYMGSPYSERSMKGEGEPTTTSSSINLQDFDQTDTTNLQRVGGESPINLYNSPCSPSDAEPNTTLRSPISSSKRPPTHRPTKSSSSTTSGMTHEKHSRGISRFFSSK